MNALTVWLMVGAPGCGKTTYSKSLVDKNPTQVVRVCPDEYRAKFGTGESDQSVSFIAFKATYSATARNLAMGKSVVVDATNMHASARKQFIQIAREHNARVVALVFEVPKNVLLDRNLQRGNNGGRNVPETVIDSMLRKYKRPTTEEVDEVVDVYNK